MLQQQVEHVIEAVREQIDVQHIEMHDVIHDVRGHAMDSGDADVVVDMAQAHDSHDVLAADAETSSLHSEETPQ